MIYVFAATFNSAKDIDFGHSLNYISAADLLKADRFKNKGDRNRMIVGRLLLLIALKKLNINLNIKQLLYSRYGRLSLGNCIDFNISHSRNVVVCAISPNETIGIDIEACEKIS